MSDKKSLIDAIHAHQWYQTIPLGDGSSTPGETGSAEEDKLEMMALPDDLSGKTVLDIGCNEGFFSFEMERRGASRVLAVDRHKGAGAKFDLIRRLKKSQVEFRAIDLYDLKPSEIGQFDIVLFLAVFHHVRYPLLALDRLFELTREYAIIEVVEALPETNESQAVLVRRMSKKGRYHMLPTRAFLVDTLTRAGFAKIELLGTHRLQKMKPERKAPGYNQQRVLVKASR